MSNFTVKYTNRDIMDKIGNLEVGILEVKGILSKGKGKIRANRKMIYASFGFTFAVLVLLVKFLIGIK